MKPIRAVWATGNPTVIHAIADGDDRPLCHMPLTKTLDYGQGVEITCWPCRRALGLPTKKGDDT